MSKQTITNEPSVSRLCESIDEVRFKLSLLQELSVHCIDEEMHLSKTATTGFYCSLESIKKELTDISESMLKI